MKSTKHYLKIIDQIEKVRTKNNINWMNILRVAFRNDPRAAQTCLKSINKQDQKINQLVKNLCN